MLYQITYPDGYYTLHSITGLSLSWQHYTFCIVAKDPPTHPPATILPLTEVRKTIPMVYAKKEIKFSGQRVCRVTFKHLPQPLRSNIQSFGTLGQILKFSKKKLKNLKMAPTGAIGGPRIFWGANISFFRENKPPVKFQNSN